MRTAHHHISHICADMTGHIQMVLRQAQAIFSNHQALIMFRSIITIVAFIFYFGLSAFPAQADFMNGNFLAGLCAADEEWESGGCVGYIVGVADSFDHLHMSRTGGGDGGKYCIPDSATRQEIVGLVVKSLNKNPDKLDNLAVHLVSNAFIDAFDCNADLKYSL